MTDAGAPERLRGNYVSMNTFDVMGVPPLLGRPPAAADARTDAPPVAVLGYRFWQRQFGGDPTVVGRTLRLEGELREVIGVMPRRFMWRGADVPPQRLERTVRADVYALDSQQPVTDVRALDAVIDEEVFARPRFSLLLLGVFAGVGLLLAVVGVYGIVAYSVAQQRAEFGVRLALGATRTDVLRLVLGRGLRLMAFGTLAGLVLALWVTRVLSAQVSGRVDARPARLRGRGDRPRRSGSAGEPAAGTAGGALEPARGAQGGVTHARRYCTTSVPVMPAATWPGKVHTNG